MPKYNVHIVLTTNHALTQFDLKDFIGTALKVEGKHYHPDHPFSDLVKTARITAIAQRPMRRPKRADVVNLKQRLQHVK